MATNGTFMYDGYIISVRLSEPMHFSGLTRKVKTIQVPGRNGDLILDTGAYENRKATAKCFFLSKGDAQAQLTYVTLRLLRSGHGYKRLEPEDDPGHYWMARLLAAPSRQVINGRLVSFDLEWDCKPQRFRTDGDTPVTISSAGKQLSNPGTGDAALPLIEVRGTPGASGYVQVGGVVVNISNLGQDGIMFLDSETQNAYYKNTNLNQNIQAEKFPVLVPGYNQVTMGGGVREIIITPRWWDL